MATSICFASLNASAQDQSATNVAQDKLSPEVAKILLPPKALDPEVLKQDGYAALLAIDAPEGMDYMQIGAQVIQCQFENHQKAIASHDSTAAQACKETKDYYDENAALEVKTNIDCLRIAFPCKTLNANNCIAQTLELKQDYLSLFEKNAVLLERYRAIQQLPHYNSYFYDVKASLPLFHYQIRLGEFRLAQAIFAFDEGNADTGFQLLAEELTFAKRQLKQDTTIIGKLIAIAHLYTCYHTINALLDTPKMQPYMQDKRLLVLLAPTSKKEETTMLNLESERSYSLTYSYTLSQENLDFLVDPPLKIDGLFDEERSNRYYQALADSSMTPDEFLRTHYNRYATTHCMFEGWQTLSHRTSLSMEELSTLYTNNQLLPVSVIFDENQQKTLCDNSAYNNQTNLIGVILNKGSESAFVQHDDYIRRIYDALVYPHLLNLKHQIISAQLKSCDVNAFLQKAGKAAQHPITREPFAWDDKTQTLSTSWMGDYPPVGARGGDGYEAMEEMSVYIPLPH